MRQAAGFAGSWTVAEASMYGNEQNFNAWMDSLRPIFGSASVDDFHASVIGLLAKMHRRREQDIRDMEAARLLPLGAEAVVSAQGICRSAAYKRASRGRKMLSTGISFR